jgi:hypothetical protein
MVDCKYSASWTGSGTYKECLCGALEYYCDRISRFPCLLARLQLIDDRSGSLIMSEADWEVIQDAETKVPKGDPDGAWLPPNSVPVPEEWPEFSSSERGVSSDETDDFAEGENADGIANKRSYSEMIA